MHTGRIKDAPAWVKPLGLQWLHRLIQDPRRLASRYGKIVPAFLFLAAAQLLGVRRYSLTR
jgi:N-acetylglucosaminyldiphosphoundecaprenol N-acetyl-beta-D-mannosaminyltransferase